MSPEALLRMYGVELDDYGAGRHYATCPKCSRDRKSAAHRNDKVLGVTIEADGSARFGCNHCNWTGPEKGKGNGADGPPLIDHVYRDKTGAPQFRKVRNAPGRQPRFWFEKWDSLRWVKGTKGVDTSILYRADEIAEAIEAGRVILCVEGEKDVDNCRPIGFSATCNAHGASERARRRSGRSATASS